MKRDTEITEREMQKLKEIADKYPYLTLGVETPKMHWGILPGNIYVCLTKVNMDGKWQYQMLVAARWGRVHDVIVLALLNIMKATAIAEEKSGLTDSTRCFLWNC
ncbi:MAG: hypothetical protein ACYC2T_08525 [Bacillota bacterium]